MKWDVFNVRALGFYFMVKLHRIQYDSPKLQNVYFAFHLLEKLFMTL